jgi:two-component system CheB/CheR fusion protein
MPAEKNAKFEALLDYLKRSRGFDFTGYKRSSLMRRVIKRMQMVGIEDYGDYVDHLEVHPEEFAHLFNTILINVTAFFRDEAAWDYLAQTILPAILAEKKAGDPVRLWSAGCASGEEAYTVAILLAEAMGPDAFRQRVKIYATDVDEEALAQARQGGYTDKNLQPLPAELRDKYFELAGNRYVFRADLRRSIIFGRHDLVQDAPISRLDLLVCRNVLMYFNAEAQARILARLHFALNDNGYVFLGKAEMLLTHANLFSPADLKHRIFTKAPRVNLRDRLLVLAQAGDAEAVNHLGRQVRLRETAFDAAPVAQLVVDTNNSLALANEHARLLFSLNPHDVGRPLQDLEVSYRPIELRSLIEQAYAGRGPVRLNSIERRTPDGSAQYYDVQVSPLQDNGGGALGVSITFTDVTQSQRLQEQLVRSNQELETAYEELQSAHEELETTNEELQSTNEELETTNEELQSANEELETMNEELQSTNEELQTINEELRERTEELDSVNNFLQSILTSLRVGMVVVDHQLKVLIWNRRAEDLWGLRADEAQKRSLLDLDIGLPVDRLPIPSFLAGKSDFYEVVLDAINRRGKAIKCLIVCTPFVSASGERQGVVLTIEDATEREQTVASLREGEERFRVTLAHFPIIAFMQDKDLRYTWIYNPTPNLWPEMAVGKRDADLFSPGDAARLDEIKRRAIDSGLGAREEVPVTRDGQARLYDLIVEPLRDAAGNIVGVTSAALDITERQTTKQSSHA